MEQEATDDARYSELLTKPLDMPVKLEEDATITRTRASPMVKGCLPLHYQGCAGGMHTVSWYELPVMLTQCQH